MTGLDRQLNQGGGRLCPPHKLVSTKMVDIPAALRQFSRLAGHAD